MKLDDWESVSDAKSEQSAYHSLDGHHGYDCPPYEKTEAMTPRRPDQPSRLWILGATWGGVNVTEDVRSMISAQETLVLDMNTVHQVLKPDPLFGVIKTLTVLYQYEDQDDVHLLNTTEHVSPIIIFPTAHQHGSPASLKTLDRPWKAHPYGLVEIVALLYGPKQIDTPSVLQELSMFFEGRRGQIRMTNSFFKADTWHGRKKSWTVYFRFTHSKRIQCVTGLEDGALEVPWTRN